MAPQTMLTIGSVLRKPTEYFRQVAPLEKNKGLYLEAENHTILE